MCSTNYTENLAEVHLLRALCSYYIVAHRVYLPTENRLKRKAHGAELVFRPPSLLKPLFFPIIHSLRTYSRYTWDVARLSGPSCLCVVAYNTTSFAMYEAEAVFFFFCSCIFFLHAGRSASCVALWVSKLLYNS